MKQALDAVKDESSLILSMHVPDHIYYEFHREQDACDVIVRMEDGAIYTALFVTMPYLERQMELCYQVTRQMPDTPVVRYAILDTPHVLVNDLEATTIEDTIDNLIALDVFEGLFTRVTSESTDDAPQTPDDSKLATQEVAAVVISDVLVVDVD